MAEKMQTKLLEEEKIEQLIVFLLGKEEYALKITDVREIIRTGIVTPIPDSPEFISGVINVRGTIVGIIDLKALFFLPTSEQVMSKHIIIAAQDNNLTGLLVDEVSEVLRIPAGSIKEAPEIVSSIHEKYISGVVTLEKRLIIMLDLSKVLSEKELTELAETAKKAQKHYLEVEAKKHEKKKRKDLDKEKIENKETKSGLIKKGKTITLEKPEA